MVDAIELVLRQRNFRAGDLRVGYQSCNDTVGDEPYDTSLCRRNARAYVDTEDVVGVIGPWNSGCAIEQIPIVSRREAGPLAMISPSNTHPDAHAHGLVPVAVPGRCTQLRTRRHSRSRAGAGRRAAREGPGCAPRSRPLAGLSATRTSKLSLRRSSPPPEVSSSTRSRSTGFSESAMPTSRSPSPRRGRMPSTSPDTPMSTARHSSRISGLRYLEGSSSSHRIPSPPTSSRRGSDRPARGCS